MLVRCGPIMAVDLFKCWGAMRATAPEPRFDKSPSRRTSANLCLRSAGKSPVDTECRGGAVYLDPRPSSKAPVWAARAAGRANHGNYRTESTTMYQSSSSNEVVPFITWFPEERGGGTADGQPRHSFEVAKPMSSRLRQSRTLVYANNFPEQT